MSLLMALLWGGIIEDIVIVAVYNVGQKLWW